MNVKIAETVSVVESREGDVDYIPRYAKFIQSESAVRARVEFYVAPNTSPRPEDPPRFRMHLMYPINKALSTVPLLRVLFLFSISPRLYKTKRRELSAATHFSPITIELSFKATLKRAKGIRELNRFSYLAFVLTRRAR